MDANQPPGGSSSGPGSGLADTDPAVADTEASDPGTDAENSATSSRGGGGRGPRHVRAGDTLGRYDLLDEIGEGGMATVFRARDRELRREVAIKVLFPHLARRDEVVRRFQREARAAAGLEHANILRIYDVGGAAQQDDDTPPFIVMELVRGRTLLEEAEQRGPLLAEVVACIGALLADALAAAHAASIVHRDIKPSNVLIAQGGRLLLADFGVARLETDDSSLVTRTGALLGTPAYMSPEQASGDVATARSDIYSLGATLYQLSTGYLPYSGSPAKVMSLIATGALVSPNRRRTQVGPDLSRAIERMMATDPGERPATASAVAAELRELATAGGLGDPAEELAAYFENADDFLARCTPRVVSAIVAAGKQALAESRLPRAIALADRASSLAPDDEAVKTLVETVTEGGRASRRRKVLLAGAAGVLALGGVAFGVTRLTGGSASAPDAVLVALGSDAGALEIGSTDAGAVDPVDAASIDGAPIDAERLAPAIDAHARAVDARIRRHVDARVAVAPTLDAAPIDAAVAIDAAPKPIDAAPPRPGRIVVSNDTWCEVAIDGESRGRLNPGAHLDVEVSAGRHVVTCAQPGINPGWRKQVDVTAGLARTVSGTLLTTVDVHVAITGDRVKIDGRMYSRGDTAKLKVGRHQAVLLRAGKPAVNAFFDVPRIPCRLHEQGSGVVCDP